MSAISHHPDAATLLSYAAGSLPEPLAAVVAVHLDMCGGCRREVARINRVGASLVEALAPVAMTGARPDPSRGTSGHNTPGHRTSGEAPPTDAPRTRGPADTDPPAALVKLAGPDLSKVAWRWLAPGVWHKPLPLSPGVAGDLRLIKIAAGQTMPDHGHGGTELTLLLQGSYRDGIGLFQPGDVADLDELVEHQPVADPQQGCICLIASERKARFKSLLARLYQPLTGM